MKTRPRQTERLYAHRAGQDGEEMQRRADRVERVWGCSGCEGWVMEETKMRSEGAEKSWARLAMTVRRPQRQS